VRQAAEGVEKESVRVVERVIEVMGAQIQMLGE
jgi:hypothetical protein